MYQTSVKDEQNGVDQSRIDPHADLWWFVVRMALAAAAAVAAHALMTGNVFANLVG